MAKLLDFEKDGDFTLVAQIGDDTKEVADIVERIYQTRLMDKIGIDPSEIGDYLMKSCKEALNKMLLWGFLKGGARRCHTNH